MKKFSVKAKILIGPDGCYGEKEIEREIAAKDEKEAKKIFCENQKKEVLNSIDVYFDFIAIEAKLPEETADRPKRRGGKANSVFKKIKNKNSKGYINKPRGRRNGGR